MSAPARTDGRLTVALVSEVFWEPDGRGRLRDRLAQAADRGADVAVLTNRFSSVMPLKVRAAIANGTAARLLHDDGGSTIYGCAGCDPVAPVHWRFELEGVESNIDLVVLQAPASREALSGAIR